MCEYQGIFLEQAYLLCCRVLDRKMNTVLMLVQKMLGVSRTGVETGEQLVRLNPSVTKLFLLAPVIQSSVIKMLNLSFFCLSVSVQKSKYKKKHFTSVYIWLNQSNII